MDKVLIDTDVFMDFFYDRKPFSIYATELLNLCAEMQIKGYTTPVIISNVYYLLRKTAQHQTVVDRIKQLISFITIITIEKNAVMNSLNSEFKDFEDALQCSAAIENGQINTIITRNIKDYKKSELAVLTPETYVKGRNSIV